MASTTIEHEVRDFLARKRVAVAGVSRQEGHHPAGDHRRIAHPGCQEGSR